MNKLYKLKPLMPKAKAVWLVENTSLTFLQIAEFCDLHPSEVQAIANDESGASISGLSPIISGDLTKEEIDLCQKSPNRKLNFFNKAEQFLQENKNKKVKKGKYIPVARRRDKPDAIAWLVKNCPEMPDQQIAKLVGTTKAMIQSIRDKEHWNMLQIKPRDPVLLGLCNQGDLDAAITKAKSNHSLLQEEVNHDLHELINIKKNME